MVNDSLGDLIIRLKNASMAGKPTVSVPYSALICAVAEKLEACGFVKAVGKRGKKARKTLEIELSYDDGGMPRISDVARISKPGRRIYQGVTTLRPVKHGFGLLVLSTPKGILTGEEARKEHVGGEALFKVW